MNKFESKYFSTAKRMDEAFLELLDKKEFEYITVKEICEKASVNRSTFYLHYETMNDLLMEVGEYIGKRFAEYFNDDLSIPQNIKESELNNLMFINDDYLTPWLTFIWDNKKLFQTFIKRHDILGMENNYTNIFNHVIRPVLERFEVKSEDHEYLFAFYVEGIVAIVKVWIRDGCTRPIEELIEIIKGCVRTYEA